MTVVEDRPIMSVNHCLPVLLLAKTITHPAARSLCDSWASCSHLCLQSVFFMCRWREDDINRVTMSGRLLHRPPAQQSSAPALATYPAAHRQQPAVAVAAGRWDGGGGMQECAGCGCVISERYLLRALDRYWHEDCLKCSCCDCRLGEVGSTLFTKANLLLCRRDYLR